MRGGEGKQHIGVLNHGGGGGHGIDAGEIDMAARRHWRHAMATVATGTMALLQ